MGIFFKSNPTGVQATTRSLPPSQGLTDQTQTEKSETSKPIWGRLIFATVILVAIFVGCVYTAHDGKLDKLYELLLHSFELLLGAFLGILTGEIASRKN